MLILLHSPRPVSPHRTPDRCPSRPSFAWRGWKLSGIHSILRKQESPLFRWRRCEFCVSRLTFDEWIAVVKLISYFVLSSLQGFLYAPDGLPNNHPGLDQYFVPAVTPYALFPIVYFNHPDIHEAYRQGKSIPQGHPVVMDLVRSSVSPSFRLLCIHIMWIPMCNDICQQPPHVILFSSWVRCFRQIIRT